MFQGSTLLEKLFVTLTHRKKEAVELYLEDKDAKFLQMDRFLPRR